MALVNEGSHSYTCHPHVYPQVPLLSSRKVSSHFGRYLFLIPPRVGDWVGLDGWLHYETVIHHNT